MRHLGRVALLCCGTALVGCGGVEMESPTSACLRTPSPPSGFCEDGRVVPVYRNTCLVSYECDITVTANSLPRDTCPQFVPPEQGFCELGTIVPVYEGKCIVAHDCI